MAYYLLTEGTKHLLSGLSIYLDRCVQTLVAAGNNQSARLIVSYFIIDTYMNGCSYIVILTSRSASPCCWVDPQGQQIVLAHKLAEGNLFG